MTVGLPTCERVQTVLRKQPPGMNFMHEAPSKVMCIGIDKYICVYIVQLKKLEMIINLWKGNLSIFKCKYCTTVRPARDLCVLADLEFIMNLFPLTL